MRNPSLLLLLAALCAAPVRAQSDTPTAEAIKREGLENSQVMAILDRLTNGVGHRLTGSADVILTRYGDRSADDFDYTGLSGTAEYAYGFDLGSLANAVEAAYLWRLALLGGGPRAEEDS